MKEVHPFIVGLIESGLNVEAGLLNVILQSFVDRGFLTILPPLGWQVTEAGYTEFYG